jgi:hypothetical protein
MTQPSKLAEENATLRKIAEHNAGGQRSDQIRLKALRNLLSDARKDRDAAVLENQNLKRKREGSTSPPPPQFVLLTRPQGMTMDQHPAPSPARIESPSAKQPATKRSRNRKDRWANVPTTNVNAHTTNVNMDGKDKASDPVLHSALTSFQHSKADTITQIFNASADHLKLGRNNELGFHRTSAPWRTRPR